MAEVHITRGDIDSLTAKLVQLEPDLTEAEQALLLFMLGVAADSINRSETDDAASPLISSVKDQSVLVVVTVTESLPSIQDQFANAFVPGAAGRVSLVPGSVGPGQVD